MIDLVFHIFNTIIFFSCGYYVYNKYVKHVFQKEMREAQFLKNNRLHTVDVLVQEENRLVSEHEHEILFQNNLVKKIDQWMHVLDQNQQKKEYEWTLNIKNFEKNREQQLQGRRLVSQRQYVMKEALARATVDLKKKFSSVEEQKLFLDGVMRHIQRKMV